MVHFPLMGNINSPPGNRFLFYIYSQSGAGVGDSHQFDSLLINFKEKGSLNGVIFIKHVAELIKLQIW